MAETAATSESTDKPQATSTNRPPQKKKTTSTAKTDNVKPGQEGPAS